MNRQRPCPLRASANATLCHKAGDNATASGCRRCAPDRLTPRNCRRTPSTGRPAGRCPRPCLTGLSDVSRGRTIRFRTLSWRCARGRRTSDAGNINGRGPIGTENVSATTPDKHCTDGRRHAAARRSAARDKVSHEVEVSDGGARPAHPVAEAAGPGPGLKTFPQRNRDDSLSFRPSSGGFVRGFSS